MYDKVQKKNEEKSNTHPPTETTRNKREVQRNGIVDR